MNRRSFLGGLAGLAAPLLPAAGNGLGFQLVDVTAAAGIDFHHNSGAFGAKYLPETMGSGCAFLDYDGDGWLDILLVNGMDWPGHKRQRSTLKLYRNNRNGTFTDVTERAGLAVEMYGMGVAVADYNNDGFPDILITAVGQNRLFRNTGKAISSTSPRRPVWAGATRFSTSALWFDFDRDGLLDLLVCNYVKWSPRARRVLQRGRPPQILLHAGGLSRRDLLAVSQPRQRHVRGCDRQERHLRQHLEIAGRGAGGLRPRRLAGRAGRQRHAAQQALSQSAQRHVRGRGCARRHRLQRGRQGARRDGNRRGRLRQLRRG